MKVLTTAGLTKLIQLCKNAIPTVPVTDVTVGGTSVVSSGVAVVPAIPTVNNPTITITQGGVTKGSFTLNQASGDTIALDAGGGGSVPDATDQVKGIAKLYNRSGSNTDGSMTQSAITNQIVNSVNTREISEGTWIDIWFSSYWSGTRVYLEDIKNQSSTTYATYLSTLSDLYTNRSATMATLKIPYNSGRTCYLYLVDNNEYYFFLPKDGKRLRVYDDNGTIKFEEAMFKDFALMSDLPTVNNSTITITQGGVTKGSFTLNQASGDTIALDAGGVYHPDLFDWKWADHQLNDVQWLRADTFSWQDGSVYEAAYDHLEADITGKTLTSETVAGVTVQFYLADDGHKICPDTEESNVASIYTATGVAWYYIIDTVNERFKLPRTKFGVTGLRDTVGNYVAPGLPDITSGGAAVMAWYNNQSTWTQGSLKKTDTTAGSMATSGNWTNAGITALRASFESSIYGNSTTVQAPATQMYLYFFVGEFTQTALENTAGLNASLFNGKADVDLSNAASNASSSAKETIVGWGLPDYSASVSKNVGTSYTATEDGVVEVYIQTNNNVRMAFTFNGVETRFATSVAGTGGFGTVYKPIKAGDTYLVSQTAGEGTYDVFLYQFTPYSY